MQQPKHKRVFQVEFFKDAKCLINFEANFKPFFLFRLIIIPLSFFYSCFLIIQKVKIRPMAEIIFVNHLKFIQSLWTLTPRLVFIKAHSAGEKASRAPYTAEEDKAVFNKISLMSFPRLLQYLYTNLQRRSFWEPEEGRVPSAYEPAEFIVIIVGTQKLLGDARVSLPSYSSTWSKKLITKLKCSP